MIFQRLSRQSMTNRRHGPRLLWPTLECPAGAAMLVNNNRYIFSFCSRSGIHQAGRQSSRSLSISPVSSNTFLQAELLEDSMVHHKYPSARG